MRILSIFFILFCSTLSAEELTVSWSTEFTGTLDGKEQVRILLYRNKDNSLTGSYYNTQKLVRYKISGVVSGARVKFSQMDGDKKLLEFSGKLILEDKKQVLTGKVSRGEKEFKTSLKYHIRFPAKPGGNLYSPICADSTGEVEKFAATVKKNILEQKKDEVAAIIHYPLHTWIDGKDVKIMDQQEFVQKFDKIFYPEFVKKIKENCFPMNMCNSYKGVWFGFNRELIIQMCRKGDEPFRLRIAEINNKTKVEK